MEKTAALGSYDPSDVTFLLKEVALSPTGIDEKEAAIQSGTHHYSEMVSFEKAPSSEYMALFGMAMVSGAMRFGAEAASIAHAIAAAVDGPITLISLVRAGLPLGVVLHRSLRYLGRDVEHYGVSIIRDKGLDVRAMETILSRRPIESIVFVDGWTGKGAITNELHASFSKYTEEPPRLAVLADPCGKAWIAGSGDDWLIPSGILGSTVSGLISRSVLTNEIIENGDYHGCVQWRHLEKHDISVWFADEIWKHAKKILRTAIPSVWPADEKHRLQVKSKRCVSEIAIRCDVDSINRIKPGIAEATRVILRRVPEKVFVSDPNDPELAVLMHLIADQAIPYEVSPELIAPYRAVTVIKKVK